MFRVKHFGTMDGLRKRTFARVVGYEADLK